MDRSEAKGSKEPLDRREFGGLQDRKVSRACKEPPGRPETKVSKGSRAFRA